MLPRGFWVDPDRIVRIVCIDRIDRIDEWEPLNASKQTRSPPLHQCHLNPLHCGCAMESFCAPRNPSAAELGPLLWALPGPAQWIQDSGPQNSLALLLQSVLLIITDKALLPNKALRPFF